ARQREVGRDLAGHLREPLAHGVHLTLQQWRVARGHRRLEQAAQRLGAEAHLEEGELHRVGADVDTADRVSHGPVYSSRQYWRTPAACSAAGLSVCLFASTRFVSRSAVIFFFTRP